MNPSPITPVTLGSYTGAVTSAFNDPALLEQLRDIRNLLQGKEVERLSQGADYVIKRPLNLLDGQEVITIKIFKRQNRLKDWYDSRHKSKAERSFRAAVFLQENHIGTPAPIAWFDRWENGRLQESYYLCRYEPAICFRDALSDIYYNQRDNAPLMDLLHTVAPAIRAMHDAGFMHGDMGNQNILLPRNAQGQWSEPQFIDLNRCTQQDAPLSHKQRAFDLSRIILPGAYLKIFKFIYSHHEDIPKELDKYEKKFRSRFEWHTRTRKYRRPVRFFLRYLKNRHQETAKPVYPSPQNIWLWDEKSAQPMTILERREKNRYRDLGYVFKTPWQSLLAMPGIFKHYRQLLATSYQQPINLKGRIGVALHPHADYIERELALLETLGNPPVLIRFCHHETALDWDKGIQLVNQLHQKGIEVMVAILQDRRALLEPALWTHFLETIISAIADKAAHIEITHAFNRVKWGIWSAREYATLMEPAFTLQERYPQIRLTGPACIDFEYSPTIAALNTIPAGKKLQALSHLLYVDRRGAPENKQGKYSTLEKCALLKALALWSNRCDDKVIVSEVNWPVKYTGIWSPIGCPYEAPKWRREEPGETEEDYANYMLRYLAITLCSGHVEQVFWWRLSAHGYGLVDDLDNFRPRPAFKALQVFLSLLGDAQFICKHDTTADTYLLEFQAPGKTLFMAWANDIEASLPPLDYQQASDAYGQAITSDSIKLNGSPIYLIRTH